MRANPRARRTLRKPAGAEYLAWSTPAPHSPLSPQEGCGHTGSLGFALLLFSFG